jgi:hypothetical protein
MHTNLGMTPDDMARIGHALYGERWQTALAASLKVADRTMRRWLAGESPIPDFIGGELRNLLVERVKEIGGMIRYSVNPADHSVMHYPSGAFFRYDGSDNLTLLNPQVLADDVVPLVTEGATEALRQERERDSRLKFEWADPTGRPSADGNTIEREYRGCVISYPRIPMFSNKWTVNLASNNPSLSVKLGGNVIIDDYRSIESAISQAERRVDELDS